MSIADKHAGAPGTHPREKGIRIFSYPKLIYMFPTLVTSLICWFGMMFVGVVVPDKPKDETKIEVGTAKTQTTSTTTVASTKYRPGATERYLGMLFLGVLALNLMVIAFDFPRFTIVAGGLLATTIIFLVLWLSVYFDLLPILRRTLSGFNIYASPDFYLGYATVLLLFYGVISLTRWLDYWEILPNELLHHHGPLSDLERFPTTNLKFDKEIPDILEHALLGAGRLVLHVQNEKRSIILDNVLGINQKEDKLKKLMSRMEVRVTTDQETSDPGT